MSEEQLVVASTDAGVRTITINRPSKKNALTTAMYSSLVEALRDASADPKVRVVVLTGAGDTFTAGNDLMDFAMNRPESIDTPVIQFLRALVDFEKPLIAAVNGLAIGIGVTMLQHCDLVYASEEATFQMPFVTLGLVPEGASSLLLPQIVGLQRASEWLLFGERVSAERLREAGLVNETRPAAELVAYAHERARALAERPAASLRQSKKLLRGQSRSAIHEAITREAVLFFERLGSPEAAEAFTAFFEKRKPDFTQFD